MNPIDLGDITDFVRDYFLPAIPEAGFDNQVSRIEVFLKEGGTEVAPAVNGIYTYEVRFTHSI